MRCFLRYIVVVFFVFFMQFVVVCGINSTLDSEDVQENSESCINQNYIIISTVDGIITALDMKTGEKCWSTLLDANKFVSSTLSELEIYENGHRIWLVPSLDGSLFKYDNFKILPLPFDVDTLLSHSSFLDASTNVFGGKIKIIFGIDRLTGEIIYTCKDQGCDYLKNPLPKNILVIEEIIQVVNAIDSSIFDKKWHFRVVELKLKLTSKVSTDNTSEMYLNSHKNALIPTNFKEFIPLDIYKISLQNGFAGMIDNSSVDFSWLYKTSCPINEAWYVKDNIIKILDPFDKDSGFFSVEMGDGKHSALLFLGTYENQMFIKKSKKFPMKNINRNSLSTNVLYQTYSFPVCHKSTNLITSDSAKELMPTELDFNDYGAYFYINFSVAENTTHCIINTSYIMQKDNNIKLSYWFGLMSTILSATVLALFILIFQVFHEKKEYVNAGTSVLELQVPEKQEVTESCQGFISRFYQDFDLIAVLGKGGFGVVMDVKNKIDDCRYAVKRICLNEQIDNSQYERVLREVKALAKLDHHGIVRYFNAWIEYPPLGWQEKKDVDSNICDISKDLSSLSSNSQKYSKKQAISQKAHGKMLNQNPFQLFSYDLYNESNKFNTDQKIIKRNSLSSQSEKSSDVFDINKFQNSNSGYSSKNDLGPYENGLSSYSTESLRNNSISNDIPLNDSYKKYSYSKNIAISSCHSSSTKQSSNFDRTQTNSMSSDIYQKKNSKNSDSMDGIYFEVVLPEEHIKCCTVLKNLNESLIKQMDLYTFDSLCTYFFHDTSISSVTERSDWRNVINAYAFSKKDLLFYQQWLICILCLARSCKKFDCELAMTNFCYILWDINKMLSDPYFMDGHLSDDETNSSQRFSIQSHSHTTSSDEMLNSLNEDVTEEKFNDSLLVKRKHTGENKVISGYLYIQMQLCQKESLHDWLNRNSNHREYSKVIEIFYEIVDAVDYVHNCGLMHRDLKPSNIYFSLEGAIKIGDFGLATSAEIHGEDSVNRKEFSCIHTCDIGTEIYMSPEQKLKQDYDCKTDIYSLGIILFELLVPFKTLSERYQVLSKVKHSKFPPEFQKKYTSESELVKQLLDTDPKSRPSTNEIKKHPLFLNYSPAKQL